MDCNKREIELKTEQYIFSNLIKNYALTSSKDNLKLGEEVFFRILWTNSENTQVAFFAQKCEVIDKEVEIAIIDNTCLATVVGVTRFVTL